MKQIIQKLSNEGWDGLNATEKDILRKSYPKEDLQIISNEGWENAPDSTKNNFRKSFEVFDRLTPQTAQDYEKQTQQMIGRSPDVKQYDRTAQVLFPRTSRTNPTLDPASQQLTSLGLDLLSIPGRFGAGLVESGRDLVGGRDSTLKSALENTLENFARTEASRDKNVVPNWLPQSIQDSPYSKATQGISNFVEDVQRSPFTVIPGPSKIAGTVFGPKLGQILLEKTPALVQGAGRVAAEGAMVPAMMSVDRLSRGEEAPEGRLSTEFLAGSALGLIPGIRQFSQNAVDKKIGKDIIAEAAVGSRTPPLTTSKLEADQMFRDGFKKFTANVFDDNLSTEQNIKNIYENYRKLPPGSVDLSENVLKSYYDMFVKKEAPKLLPTISETGAAMATNGASIIPTIAKKVVQNPATFYGRSGNKFDTGYDLGLQLIRPLYQQQVDVLKSENKKETK